MLVDGNTFSGGGLSGRHVPLPTGTRPLPERPRRTGLDWAAHTTGPDPDAIARVKAMKPAPTADKRRREFDVAKAAKAYEDGATLAQLQVAVAAETGRSITAETIRKRIIEAGVKMRPQASIAPKRISDEDIATILADRAAGKPIRQTAAELGIGHATVARYRRAQDATQATREDE